MFVGFIRSNNKCQITLWLRPKRPMMQIDASRLLPAQLLNSHVFSVVITDLNGRFLYVNPLFRYKFSHVPQIAFGHFSETVFAEDTKLCNDAAKACIRNPDQFVTVTVRKSQPQENYFWTQWEISALRNEYGTPIGIISVGHDVASTESTLVRAPESSQLSPMISHSAFRYVANHVPGVLYRCIAHPHQAFEFISDEIQHLSGYHPDHFLGKPFEVLLDLIHPDDRPLVENTMRNAILNKHHFELEYRLQHLDGHVVWVFERGKGVFDAVENTVYLDGCMFDIGSRKKIEAALEKSEDEAKRLALVAQNTTNSVLIADKDELVIWVNEGFSRMSGYRMDDVKGKRLGFTLEGHPEQAKTLLRLREALAKQKGFKEECISYHQNGTAMWLEVDCQPLFDEMHAHIGYLSIENDITHRKQAQLEQQEILQRLTLATDSAKIGIWEIDLKDNHIIWDDKMYEMYGYEKDTTIPAHKIWKRALYPNDLEYMQQIIQDLMDGKKDIDAAVYRIVLPSGKIRHIESHAITKKSNKGDVLRLIGTNRNITDDIAVQEKLKTQNKILRDIAFIQSHEVRRPLANILGVIEVLNSSNAVHNKEIFDHLIESANELDMQIRSIVKKTNNIDGLLS